MNTTTETCPSLEDLAAFLEGKLSGDERARIVAHLADCPSCYEVFAEAARFQLAEEEEEEDADPPDVAEVPREDGVMAPAPARVIWFPMKKILPWAAAAIAAVLVIGIGVPRYQRYQQYNTAPEMTSAKLVSPAVAKKAAADELWDTMRGPSAQGEASSTASEFLLGAYALDLHLSLHRNDSARAMNDLSSINGQMIQLGAYLPDQAKAYLDIHSRIAKGKQPKDFVREAARMESELDAMLAIDDTPYSSRMPQVLTHGWIWLMKNLFRVKEAPSGASYFAFGKWAEAGRLASFAESSDFFQSPENRKFLQVFLRQEQENLDPEVVKALEAIRQALDRPDPSSLPYKDLNRQFESILKHYQEESTESGLP
jgi:hypothetical protein